jgi:hypothetical protein
MIYGLLHDEVESVPSKQLLAAINASQTADYYQYYEQF